MQKNKKQRVNLSFPNLLHFDCNPLSLILTPFLQPLLVFTLLHTLSAPVFLPPSRPSANGSARVQKMDGVSIFRRMEGGQTKSKLGREGAGRGEGGGGM